MPARKTHGLSKHPLFCVWSAMMRRCYEKHNKRYHRYGLRGISVCIEWQDPAVFILWANQSGYRRGLSLERKENDLGYNPSNCTWIPKGQQNRNKSNNRRLSAFGKSMLADEWAAHSGIRTRTIMSRLRLGWSDADAVSIPTRPINRSANA